MIILRPSVSLLILAVLAVSCSIGDFYDDQAYVLYDSTTPPAKGSPERAELEQIAAESDAGRGESASAAADEETGASVARIFVLENLRDELARAIDDGVGDVDALRKKRDDVDREIAWRTAAVGEAVGEARAERLRRLLGYPIVLR